MAYDDAKCEQAMDALAEQVVEQVMEDSKIGYDKADFEIALGNMIHDLSGDVYSRAEKLLEERKE